MDFFENTAPGEVPEENTKPEGLELRMPEELFTAPAETEQLPAAMEPLFTQEPDPVKPQEPVQQPAAVSGGVPEDKPKKKKSGTDNKPQ